MEYSSIGYSSLFLNMQIENDKPTSFNLGELKSPLQKWAMDEDRSMHYIVLRIIREAVVKKFGTHYQKKRKTA